MIPIRSLTLQVRRRICLALCASALVHAWLLLALPPAQQVRPAFAIQARIEPRELQMPLIHSIAERIEKVEGPRTSTPAPFPSATPAAAERARAAPVVAARRTSNPTSPEARGTGTLPKPLDTTWYAAHDLDIYPRALTPFTLAYSGRAETGNDRGRVLLWLHIDEYGQVVEVKPGEPATPGDLVEAARASLAAIRFAPARKEERPVKSRVLLSVSLAVAASGEP